MSEPSLPSELVALADERFERFFAAARAREVDAPDPRRLPGTPERVWACSEWVAETCIRRPALLAELAASGDLDGARPAEWYARRLADDLDGIEAEAALMEVLRARRRREMLRIAWRDLGGLAGFEETVRETSELAAAVLDAALARLHEWLAQRCGEPRRADGDPQRMTVLALGKLGAAELNFSSDIDLLFAFPEAGETRGAGRSIANEEFFTRLGRRLIHVLTKPTGEGIVYRVDMRLRPFGASGPLASSFNALEDYYQIHGRDWERYALIRARPVAGDTTRGERLLERLRPFVYRRYIDFAALESLRDMKQLIAEEVSRKGLEDNVKLGRGGIREIEFIGQAFQLVRGGRTPDLRDRRILAVLERLATHEYLPDYAVRHLSAAYRFLRTTEHRLQQARDRQTHELPVEGLARRVLASGMACEDWNAFARALERHRDRVHAQFDQIFGAPLEASEPAGGALDAAWRAALEEASLAAGEGPALLAEAGFGEPDTAWELLRRLRRSYTLRALGERGQRRLARLVPALLAAVSRREHPETTLGRVLQVVESIARRSVYLALLVERPLALSQLVRLCEASPLIARHIARHPVVLDELLDARTLYAPLDREALEHEAAERLDAASSGDTEQEIEALHQLVQANVLRVAAADIARAIPLMVVSDHLTAIAEVALVRVLRMAWRDLGARHGEPRCTVDGERRSAGFVVVAYGKLGGIELGYGSDLDLVFLHGSGGEDEHTDGERSVDNSVFFSRLGQRVIHFLTTRTGTGRLYEVDSRLRPSGSSGLLVSGIEAFREYQLNDAWTWEHQALVRARAVAGDEALAERFGDIRREVLCAERDPEALRGAVRDMRDRMRRELGSRSDDRFDLKQDAGGIADIEFMVQYGTLRWARELGSYLEYTDNIRLLEGFAHSELLSGEDVQTLSDAYRAYRARVHAMSLQEQRPVVPAPAGPGDEFHDERRAVVAIWSSLMGD